MLPAPGIGPAGEGSSRPATGTSSTLGEAMRAPSTTTPEVVVLDDFPAELARREVLDPREDLWLSTSDGYVCLVSLPVVGSCAGSVPAAVPTLRMARGSIAWDRLPPLHCVDRFPSPIPVLTCAQPLLLPDHPSQGRCRPLLRDVLRKSRCPSSPRLRAGADREPGPQGHSRQDHLLQEGPVRQLQGERDAEHRPARGGPGHLPLHHRLSLRRPLRPHQADSIGALFVAPVPYELMRKRRLTRA